MHLAFLFLPIAAAAAFECALSVGYWHGGSTSPYCLVRSAAATILRMNGARRNLHRSAHDRYMLIEKVVVKLLRTLRKYNEDTIVPSKKIRNNRCAADPELCGLL